MSVMPGLGFAGANSRLAAKSLRFAFECGFPLTLHCDENHAPQESISNFFGFLFLIRKCMS